MKTSLSQLSDADLLSELRDSLIEERERLVFQLKHLAELERRKLFLHYQSLWHYLTRELGLEESSAYRRIQAARLLVKFPEIESSLESGRLNLSLLSMADEFFRGGRISFGELFEILAKEYLSRHHPEERLRRAEERSQRREALKLTLEQPTEAIKTVATSEVKMVETENEAQAETPSRRASQRLIRALIRKEGYRCTYRDPVTKLSCSSTYGLEIDHKKAWAMGGKTEIANLRFYCRNHNLRAAIVSFGVEKVRR